MSGHETITRWKVALHPISIFLSIYAFLSLLCVYLGTIAEAPKLDGVAGAVLPYVLLLLGPPITLSGGMQFLKLYIIETIAVVGMMGLDLALFRRSSDWFPLAVVATGVLWLCCSLLPIVFVI
jgi:hypothetical protein